jgi:hypothetical protein
MNFGTLSGNRFQAILDYIPDQDEMERFADHDNSEDNPSIASGGSTESGTHRPQRKKVKKNVRVAVL